jgi:beta-lactamase superfamily II metal-dependent hydrolase
VNNEFDLALSFSECDAPGGVLACPGLNGAYPVGYFGVAINVFSTTGRLLPHLQLHFINVGQGDGAVLVTPAGQTVLFDNGVVDQCHRPVSYLQRIGLTRIDYHIASHYHADHIGCTAEVLSVLPLQQLAFDRGGSYGTQTYMRYAMAVGGRRMTAPIGSTLPLDSGVMLDFVAANGAGVPGVADENDLSVVVRVRYGQFDAVIAGDLSGVTGGGYVDVESTVAARIGQVEVYKVNHHASRYSSNARWLSALRPKIGIVSIGPSNSYGHPSAEAMGRLHAANVTTYWTSAGTGVAPEPGRDFVTGDIAIDVPPDASTFTVNAAGQMHSYSLWGATGAAPSAPQSLTSAVTQSTVNLTWLPATTGGVATSYVVEASILPGGPVIASLDVFGTSLRVPDVPSGTYYVRVRAAGDGQSSDPSNEIMVVVGNRGCVAPPSAPQALRATVVGAVVTLNWTAGAGGCPTTRFLVLAGSAPSLGNLAQLDVGSQTGLVVSAPHGTYYVRAVATNAHGVSAPSGEIVVTVAPTDESPRDPSKR